MIAVVVVEGVLARGDDLRNAQPTKIAKALYDGLKLTNNMIGLTRADPEIVKWWLKREHLNGWSSVLAYPDNVHTWDHWRIDQMRGFLADGWEVFAYIDTNGYVCDEVRAMGITTMALSYPAMPPGWKEAAVPRAWSDVVSTIDGSVPWKD
jgi:hypothetical protein